MQYEYGKIKLEVVYRKQFYLLVVNEDIMLDEQKLKQQKGEY